MGAQAAERAGAQLSAHAARGTICVLPAATGLQVRARLGMRAMAAAERCMAVWERRRQGRGTSASCGRVRTADARVRREDVCETANGRGQVESASVSEMMSSHVMGPKIA